MKIEDDAVHAADDAHPETKDGSDIATAPAAATGTASPAPGETMKATLAGDTFAKKVDALHTKHFAGSELTTMTTVWNKVMAFKEEVKRLAGEFFEDAEKL